MLDLLMCDLLLMVIYHSKNQFIIPTSLEGVVMGGRSFKYACLTQYNANHACLLVGN